MPINSWKYQSRFSHPRIPADPRGPPCNFTSTRMRLCRFTPGAELHCSSVLGFQSRASFSKTDASLSGTNRPQVLLASRLEHMMLPTAQWDFKRSWRKCLPRLSLLKSVGWRAHVWSLVLTVPTSPRALAELRSWRGAEVWHGCRRGQCEGVSSQGSPAGVVLARAGCWLF